MRGALDVDMIAKLGRRSREMGLSKLRVEFGGGGYVIVTELSQRRSIRDNYTQDVDKKLVQRISGIVLAFATPLCVPEAEG